MCDTELQKKGKDNSDGKDDGEYIRLAYQSTLEDIKFFKQQEWLLTYYILLIYVAIIATAKLSISQELCACSIFCIRFIITTVITVLLLNLLWTLEKSLRKHREIKKQLLKEFPVFLQQLYDKQKSDDAETSLSFIVVNLLIIIGWLFTIILLCFYVNNIM